MRHPLVILLFLAAPAAAQAPPAPPLHFEAGTVLAGGHVLQSAVTLPATSGPVSLAVQDGRLDWSIRVENGETRLLDDAGRWAAKAEYHRLMRDGSAVCQIYQTTISPEWALQGGDRSGRADYRPADDRIYSFRDVPCP
ncbi:MAG: hypothetical protein ACK4FJ_03320 [Ferrovibrio sp.]|uniref:hypothetical protein n=1 Tax=Ferrovibrio sp. TaxID=1917215 RepID=UPI00391A8F91